MFAKLRRNPPSRMGRKPKGAAAGAAAAASDGDADLDADQEFFEDGSSAADEAEDAAECAAGGGGKAANGKGKKGTAGGKAEGRADKEELRPWLYLMPGLIWLGYQVGWFGGPRAGWLYALQVAIAPRAHRLLASLPAGRLVLASEGLDWPDPGLKEAIKVGRCNTHRFALQRVDAGGLAVDAGWSVRRGQPPLCECLRAAVEGSAFQTP